MKYIVFFILLSFSIGSMVAPCPAADLPTRSEERVQMMQKGLDLTPDQVTKLRKIIADAEAQRSSTNIQNEQFKHDAMRTDRKKRESTSTRILAILTPEQKIRFQEMHNSRPNRQLLELKNKLSLTPEQMQAVEAIIVDSRGAMEALQRSGNKDSRKHHKTMKRIMDDQAKEIDKILTPEQRQAFKILRREKEQEMRNKRPR